MAFFFMIDNQNICKGHKRLAWKVPWLNKKSTAEKFKINKMNDVQYFLAEIMAL